MNIFNGIKACREAKANGADIALFPEMWSSGYTFPHNKEWLEQNSISLNSKTEYGNSDNTVGKA